MEMLFLTVLGMSGTAAAVIVLVLLARLLLRRAPKAFSYALWAVVLFRLLCPVSIPSPWSLPPKLQVEPAEDDAFFGMEIDMYHREITVMMDMDPVPSAVETVVEETGRPAPSPSPFTIAGRVWLAGTVLLLGYSAVSLLRLRRKLVGWVPLEGEKNVRLADHIPSPFVLGLFRPKVYLPSGLPEGERDYILLHERTHIRRGDHIFRALAWLAVAVHWFNPLVWLAFHLAGKDMEMSCDEAVLRKMGRDVRADYSASLLRLSQGGRLPAGPLAFGDGNPKSRIKNVLGWKKPALWVVAAALIVVVCAGAALATDPEHFHFIGPGWPAPFVYHEPGPAERWVDMTEYPPDEPWPDSVELQMPEYPGVTFRWTREMVTAIIEEGESPFPEGLGVTEDGQFILFCADTIWSVYLCDLNGDGLRDMCFISDEGERRVEQRVLGCYYSYSTWSVGYMDIAYAHFLRLEGDRLWVEERDRESGAVIRSGPLEMTETGLDIRDASVEAILPGANLTFTLDTQGEEHSVQIEGSVGGEPLAGGTLWSPPQSSQQYEKDPYGYGWVYPCGWLSMAYPAFTDEMGIYITAGWTDGSRTSVMVSTQMSAALSSAFNVGYWEYVVTLDGGIVSKMEGKSFREGLPDAGTLFYPESISDEEAVTAAFTAARLLTAAEDYYWNWAAEQDQP